MLRWYDYEKLENDGGCVSPNHQYIIMSDGGFHRCKALDVATNSTGWKLHVSVDSAQVAQAWDMVAPYLMANGVESFKVVRQELAHEFGNANSQQAGKMLTIYMHEGQKDAAHLVEGMENLLRSAGIRPGPVVAGDHAVPGSRYIHYRNDRGGDGTYLSADEASALAQTNHAESWNPSGREGNPFEGIHVGDVVPEHTGNVGMVPVQTVLSAYSGESMALKGGNDFPAVMALSSFVLGGQLDVEGLVVVQEELEKQFPQLEDLKEKGLFGWLKEHGMKLDDEVAVSQLTPESVAERRKVFENREKHGAVKSLDHTAKTSHKL